MELFINGKLNSDLLKKEKWLYYLTITNQNSVNRERIDVIDNITGKETLNYVLRTLDILENKKTLLTNKQYEIIKKVLQWSEVAKGGTDKQRKEWINKGYSLDIHNLGSAEIYLEESTDNIEETKIIYTLIKTHGILGQNIRGEVSILKNTLLLEILPLLTKDDFSTILLILNECIISGVSISLWETVKYKINDLILSIYNNDFSELNICDRLENLCSSLKDMDKNSILFFEKQIFPFFELWYFSSALSCFSYEQIISLLKVILKTENINKVTHLNFKPLADNLYYDYEGKKKINVYKQRIIEKYIELNTDENVKLRTLIVNNVLSVDFEFSKPCEKLIDFCVEAERSGLLTYEKSINVLFDMFGFRRDKFDRLNNEDKYLKVMNDAYTSTKSTLIDYVVGTKIVDVGSGGGIMLDLLEDKYHDREIIGTDISFNVVETLNKKKSDENHNWNILQHNFVSDVLPYKVDTIIFSSILHEIYSYSDLGNGKFDITSVTNALKNAFNSLNKGGRIIIRDGVKTDSNETLTVRFKTKKGLEFFSNYLHDFKGLTDIDREFDIDGSNLSVIGNINYMREFLYTYTWGNESYSAEVQEQFGYLTLNEFCNILISLGGKVIYAKEFLEQGYVDNLSSLVELDKPFPNSNCILVIEKE